MGGLTDGLTVIIVQTLWSCNIVQTQGWYNFNLTSTGEWYIGKLLYVYMIRAVQDYCADPRIVQYSGPNGCAILI